MLPIRFSLRALFVALTLIAVWLGYRTSTVHSFENAKRELQENSTIYLTHRPDVNKPNAQPSGFVSLVLFGPQQVDRVYGISARMSDQLLFDDSIAIPLVKKINKHNASLPDLTELVITHSPMTSTTMSHIGNLHFLTSLHLQNTAIDDSAISDILKLTNLTDLNIRGTKISPEGCERIRAELPNCKVLCYSETEFWLLQSTKTQMEQ